MVCGPFPRPQLGSLSREGGNPIFLGHRMGHEEANSPSRRGIRCGLCLSPSSGAAQRLEHLISSHRSFTAEHPSGPEQENPPQGRATGVRVQPGAWRRCHGPRSPGSPGSAKAARGRCAGPALGGDGTTPRGGGRAGGRAAPGLGLGDCCCCLGSNGGLGCGGLTGWAERGCREKLRGGMGQGCGRYGWDAGGSKDPVPHRAADSGTIAKAVAVRQPEPLSSLHSGW